MRSAFTAMVVTFGLGLTAPPAYGQVSLQVLGGVTRTAETSPFVAGALGGRFAVIEIRGEVGHMRNVLPKGLLDALNELQVDSPVKAIARLRNTYGIVEVRFISARGPVRPFVGVGGGIARLSPGFEVSVGGISLGDVFGLASFGGDTKPLWMAGAGLSIDLPLSAFEVGYRWHRIDAGYSGFNITGVPVTIHSVHGGLSIRF